jgi:multiple sugar transport system substrate-binding protein
MERCERALARLLAATLLTACSPTPEPTTLHFWAMGREGEVVQSLVPEFERQHPGVRVKVQQIPWNAAHEKLLTAYAGDALPDIFQLGNTWIPEFVILRAIEPLDERLTSATPRADHFSGLLATSEIDGRLYGLPWYVDTRVLFYRMDILARAGFGQPPRTWREWSDAMARIKALPDGEHYAALFPMGEWQLPVILGLQAGAGLLRDGDRYGDFRSEPFRRAFGFYLGLFRQGFTPAVAESQMANVYREFAAGTVAMLVTGPWNIGEFERRLPADLQGQWATAPLPGPDGAYPGVSLAGGASLALARSSRYKEEAWQFMEFLAYPARQVQFYRLTGDLPARRSAWADPALAAAAPVQAFRAQMDRVASTPQIPEWERIAAKVGQYAEKAARGELGEGEALSRLDADVDRILEKRRWLLDKETSGGLHPLLQKGGGGGLAAGIREHAGEIPPSPPFAMGGTNGQGAGGP